MEITEKIVKASVRCTKGWLTIPGVKRDKVRVKQGRQRRTLGYFTGCRFSGPGVAEEIKSFGFTLGNYTKVVVTWGWEDDIPTAAKEVGVELCCGSCGTSSRRSRRRVGWTTPTLPTRRRGHSNRSVGCHTR